MLKKVKKIAPLVCMSFIMIGCGGGGNTETTQAPQNESSLQNSALTTSSVADKLAYNDQGQITTIDSSASVKSIAVSKDTLFLAESENGIEIISIGYSDTISTELIYKIKDINAQEVTLSDDEKTLYVEDETGFIQIIDISDLTHPVVIGKTTKQKIDNAAIAKNGGYKYIPRGKSGLDVMNISNPSNIIKESTFNKSNAFDVVLVDDDNKALIATGAAGINLLDVTNPQQVNTIANYIIKGTSVNGLSLNHTGDILFVATGDKGVMVFNVDILMYKLGY